MELLRVVEVEKRHDSELTLKTVSLGLAEGEIHCLLGPSGCGKTTLLRIIAGLERQDSGMVLLHGKSIDGVPTHLRKFGMMFQEFALFPHKNVFENVSFGLRLQKLDSPVIRRRTEHILELVGLKGFGARSVGDLSGGERQRVALARSLAPRPRLLMLDEPMGSLDRALRERLLLDLRAILKKIRITTLFVTHDQTEAFAMADRISVLNKGKIAQTDCPERLYSHPANAFVARFLGFSNLFMGRLVERDKIETPIGIFPVSGGTLETGESAMVLIRREGIKVVAGKRERLSETIYLSATVVDRRYQGGAFHVSARLSENHSILFELSGKEHPPPDGGEIHLEVDPLAIEIIPPD